MQSLCALNLPFLFKVKNNQCVLAGYFPQMAQVDINMPHYLQIDVLLFVVDRGSAYYTVELLHEIAPVLSFKHCESTVL